MYSQYDEERHILSTLSHGQAGKFLDIGAFHPTQLSNTRALYELGWTGVLIEPSPGPFLNLVRACSYCGHVPPEALMCERETTCSNCHTTPTIRYGNDPRLHLINAAVGTSPSLIKLHCTNMPTTTSDVNTHRIWAGDNQYLGTYYIQQITLDTIFHQFGNFNFISIDAEGSSVSILFHLYSMIPGMASRDVPTCICVEHDNRIVEIMNRIQTHYRADYINGTNLVLARR